MTLGASCGSSLHGNTWNSGVLCLDKMAICMCCLSCRHPVRLLDAENSYRQERLTYCSYGAECVNAYVEWTPLGRLAASGLLRACAYLLMLPAHRLGACAVLRQVSERKQAQQVRAGALACLRAGLPAS